MRQPYFILVLAHSLHGRLRRVHIPYQILWVVLAMAAVGTVSTVAILSSYLRMTWKVSNYNSLRQEVDTLRSRYQSLQKESNQKSEQLASLQLLATQVQVAYGIKQKLEGPADLSGEGRLVPTYKESLAEYNFLKSASFSSIQRNYVKQWQQNVRPMLWPVPSRLMSTFGSRTDPFSGEGAFHTGVDLAAAMGTPVHAAADGVVSTAEWSGRYGKMVVIDHGNGMQTWYAHLSRFDVMAGQEVRVGQIVGASGGTGRVTSPHLHYEVRMGGAAVNPYPYLTSTSVDRPRQRDLPF